MAVLSRLSGNQGCTTSGRALQSEARSDPRNCGGFDGAALAHPRDSNWRRNRLAADEHSSTFLSSSGSFE